MSYLSLFLSLLPDRLISDKIYKLRQRVRAEPGRQTTLVHFGLIKALLLFSAVHEIIPSVSVEKITKRGRLLWVFNTERIFPMVSRRPWSTAELCIKAAPVSGQVFFLGVLLEGGGYSGLDYKLHKSFFTGYA